MKQQISILGGPSDGHSVALKTPLASTFDIVETTEATGDKTVAYPLGESPLSKKQVYMHPRIHAHLHPPEGDTLERPSTKD